MTADAFITCISGDRPIAGTLAIAAPGALYAVDFSAPDPKTRNRSFSRLGRETALRVRGKRIDEERRARDDHHQPLRQIYLSRREICPNKRSHPCLVALPFCGNEFWPPGSTAMIGEFLDSLIRPDLQVPSVARRITALRGIFHYHFLGGTFPPEGIFACPYLLHQPRSPTRHAEEIAECIDR